MGNCCSKFDEPMYVVPKAHNFVNVSDINTESQYEAQFTNLDNHMDAPLIGPTTPKIIAVEDSDSSEPDEEMIKELLAHVDSSSD